jgi:hypothetical protein
MASCSCIPPPASLQPRKIYNILVPDVFPGKPPKLEEPLPSGIKRKIGKLEEYLQKSPARAGKVGRGRTAQQAAFVRRGMADATMSSTRHTTLVSPSLCVRACGAQVSRRLTRRIKLALYNKQYGYVKVAVETYKYLLSKSAEPESTFTFTYFAKELVQQPDTVVRGRLACHAARPPVQHRWRMGRPRAAAAWLRLPIVDTDSLRSLQPHVGCNPMQM